MSLRWEIVLLVLAFFALDMIVVRLVERKILYPSFLALEEQEATKDIRRGVDALHRELDHLAIFCKDWSA